VGVRRPGSREARTLADAIFEQLDVVTPARVPLVAVPRLAG